MLTREFFSGKVFENWRYLMTNAGQDHFFACTVSLSAQPATATYMAVTANSTNPAAADATLTGEISTGGLSRAQITTYAHTAGAGSNVATLTKTFTYSGSGSVVLAKVGMFNASSGGTMVYETLLGSQATLQNVGDAITITQTITRN